jgi:hypothetical protein
MFILNYVAKIIVEKMREMGRWGDGEVGGWGDKGDKENTLIIND